MIVDPSAAPALAAVASFVLVAAASRLVRMVAQRARGPRRPEGTLPSTPEAVQRSAARAVRSWRERRAQRAADAALPDALERTARSLRGGASLAGALAAAAPDRPALLLREWRRLAAQSADEGVVVAANAWRAGRASDAVALTSSALVVAARVGGNQSRALDGAARTLRARALLDAEVHALTAQARSSASVLAAAPVGFAFVAGGLEPGYLPFLLATPAGWLFLGSGGGLLALGLIWMRHITAMASA